MDVLLQFILAFVLSVTGYLTPPTNPRIQFVEDEWFLNNVCPHGSRCSAVMATNKDGVIFVRGSHVNLKKLPYQALLAHEIVHYLQFREYGDTMDCKERIRREREAMLVEVLYLNRNQRTVSPTMISKHLKRYPCHIPEMVR